MTWKQSSKKMPAMGIEMRMSHHVHGEPISFSLHVSPLLFKSWIIILHFRASRKQVVSQWGQELEWLRLPALAHCYGTLCFSDYSRFRMKDNPKDHEQLFGESWHTEDVCRRDQDAVSYSKLSRNQPREFSGGGQNPVLAGSWARKEASSLAGISPQNRMGEGTCSNLSLSWI